MNILVICSDTFRWDYLGAYGNEWIQTPNLDKLAAESAIFDDAFAEGLPTLPARRVLMTGRPIVPFEFRPQKSDQVQMHGWHAMYDEDVTLAEHLREHDYIGALFADLYHMMKPGKDFHRGFDAWHWIRGQEADPFCLPDRTDVADWVDEVSKRVAVHDGSWIIRHLVNRKSWQSDADTLVGQTMTRAADWLKGYRMGKPFYLHVEVFDPHEPWDPTPEYARLYKPDYPEDCTDGVAPGGSRESFTDEQFANVRAAYAGECTMVDRWAGHLLDALAESGHKDDTIVVFTSDHGCMMGEQGEIQKSFNRLRNQVTQVPLLIRHPKAEHAGEHVGGFCQHQDIMPTVLTMAGLPVPDRVLGRDLWPQVGGDSSSVPESIVTAFGPCESIRTRTHNYVRLNRTLLDSYPRMREYFDAVEDQLYDLAADPRELTNVLADHPDTAAELARKLDAHLAQHAPLTRGTIQGAQARPTDSKPDSIPPTDERS